MRGGVTKVDLGGSACHTLLTQSSPRSGCSVLPYWQVWMGWEGWCMPGMPCTVTAWMPVCVPAGGLASSPATSRRAGDSMATSTATSAKVRNTNCFVIPAPRVKQGARLMRRVCRRCAGGGTGAGASCFRGEAAWVSHVSNYG